MMRLRMLPTDEYGVFDHRVNKADDRPAAAKTQVSFEQILIEANVSPEKQALLLADGS
jgi:hypothetical protein